MKIYNKKKSPSSAEQHVAPASESTLDLGRRLESAALDAAFAQMFSPKQKELFLKKLNGETLSKTDREYYSRVVRKRVVALANSELHQLAQRVLEL